MNRKEIFLFSSFTSKKKGDINKYLLLRKPVLFIYS
jgi:hypothetical protein